MKKLLLTILATAMLATVFAGCNDPLAEGNQTATTVATESATEVTTAETTYENTLDGIVKYMADKGYITNDDKSKKEMNADIIGAEKGYLFTKNTTMVEFYEFPAELDDVAKAVIESVKTNGYYTLAETSIKAEDDTKISAVLSDDEKFMMIYNDTEIKEEENTASETRKNAIEDFKNFNK